MDSMFFEITAIISLATFLSIVFKFLKQPSILAYLLTGIIIGPLGILRVNNQDVLQTMGEFGITFLLFTLGLELKISELKSVGKVALIVGTAQIVFTTLVGYLLSLALGLPSLASLYISIALTFSSTIITVKLLSDKKDLNSLYGKIAIGILLVQDFVAIFLLMMLSGFHVNNVIGTSPTQLGYLLFKGILLFAVVYYLSYHILPRFVHMIASSLELLFLFSIAWAFGMAALVSSPLVGFSIEIGGFLAGLSLAHSAENFQIVAKVKPLRDFFITIFFVILGIQMAFGNIFIILPAAIVLSLFVLIGEPLIVMVVMGALSFRKRTSFLTSLTVAHISEFSLILIFLAHRLGHVDSVVVSLVTVTAVFTFTISTYMILSGNRLYKMLYSALNLFERKHIKWEERGELGELHNHIVLIGANRTGQSILDSLKDLLHEKVLVLDFNPDIVEELKKQGFETLFGDIADPDIQEKIQLASAKLVISTVPDVEDNLILMEALRTTNKKAKIIITAQDRHDAKELYKAGADYVVIPHLSGGRHIAKLLKEDKLDTLEHLKEKEMAYL